MWSTTQLPDLRVPGGHTSAGGVLVGSPSATRNMVLFEDPQCPYCRQFELASGDVVREAIAADAVSIEYRMRCFLGPESVRACNALASAAETGRFDPLRTVLFANQPPEHSGGFTPDDLIGLGRLAGLVGGDYESSVQQGRYEPWAVRVEQLFELADPDGTPAAWVDGRPVDPDTLYDPTALEYLLFG